MSIPPHLNRSAERGAGLVLIMVFALSAVLIAISMRMVPDGVGNVAYNKAKWGNIQADTLISVAFDEVRDDLVTRLNNYETIDTTYSKTGSISTPNDPSSLGGASTVIGTYTATITKAKDDFYMVKVVGVADGVSVESTRLITIEKPAAAYDCGVEGAAVESQILAGNIASISDADLQEWAQNNCMIKTTADTAAPTAAAGGSPSCSATTTYSNASPALQLSSSNSSCTATISGYYSGDVRVNTMTSSTFNLTYNGLQNIDIGTISSGLFNASTTATGKVFRFNNFNGTKPEISYTGTCVTMSTSGNITTYNLNNCEKISGNDYNQVCNGSMSTSGSYISGTVECDTTQPNHQVEYIFTNGAVRYKVPQTSKTTTGNDKLFLGVVSTNGSDHVRVSSEGGNDSIYLTSNSKGRIYAGAGNDIVACPGVAAGTCSQFAGQTTNLGFGLYRYESPYIYGEDGNDFISVDAVLNDNGQIEGGLGYNIIYTKGLSTSSDILANPTSGSPGSSLVVMGGNYPSGTTIQANGTNNVLLVKSGVTSGGTVSGFARTITY